MNSKFKITIPKPCHENWNTMTPKEKGRFCSSCAKTVIDFTKKTTEEIQEYLVENKNQRVCGHFYKKQLDTITIEIPQVAFQQQLSFQKLFVLALLFVMGTTLFSCQYSDGKKQKIENVILVDTIKKVEKGVDSFFLVNQKDSIVKPIKSKIPPPPKPTTGIVICETNSKKETLIDITTTSDVEEIIEEEVGKIAVEGELFMGVVIEENPRFKEAKNLTKEDAKKDFDKRIKEYVYNNFDDKLVQCLDLDSGKYKIYTQFYIDKKGNVSDIKVKAPHSNLKKHVVQILEKLPQFIPGKQRYKPVKMRYNLPITFIVE